VKKIAKQYFVEVDKDDKYRRVVWAPLLWDLTQRGYRWTGFYRNLPKFVYDGPAMVSTG
jgi:hypothetical protein